MLKRQEIKGGSEAAGCCQICGLPGDAQVPWNASDSDPSSQAAVSCSSVWWAVREPEKGAQGLGSQLHPLSQS